MQLRVLGRPRLTDGAEEVALQPLPGALLAYLAIGGPRRRAHLAELFWPRSANPLNTLSTTLNRIRTKIPDAIWTIEPDEVGSDLPTDVCRLRAAVEDDDVASVSEIYCAPFLDGFALRRMSVEFEEWILEQRTALATLVELSLLREGHRLETSGDHLGAGRIAAKAWGVATNAGFPSPDHIAAYHRLLGAGGQPTAAAVRLVAEEFGIALDPVAPVDLPSRQIVDTVAATAPPPLRAGQIATTLPMFGFENERTQLAALVDAHRITTIVGLGGSGKTRLAEDLFESSDALAAYDQRYWVMLREIEDAMLVGPTVAAALDVPFVEGPALAGQLPEHHATLIVLDNFEHLLGAADIVRNLVDGHPGVTVLITSRESLGIKCETVLRLTGLAVTRGDGELSPAEELFLSAAQRAGAPTGGFADEELSTVAAICERLGGNPLALELAGAWLPLLAPADVLSSLELRADLLASAGAPGGRSMTVVLDQSWASLRDRERWTLQLLATFPAGCAVAEAIKMPALEMASIRELMQRSMVSADDRSRLTIHPLVADRVRAELDRSPETEQEVRRVQREWCWSFLSDLGPRARGSESLLRSELPNVIEAWSWGIAHRDWHLALAAIPVLREFHAESGRVLEGVSAFEAAAGSVRSDNEAPPRLLVELLEATAWLETLAGRSLRAQALLDEALAASSPALGHAHAQLLRTLGFRELQAGKNDTAAATFEEALRWAGDDESNLVGTLRHDLGQVLMFQGFVDRARASFRSALDIGRATDDPSMVVRAYLTLGNLETDHGPSRAVVLLQEGQAIATAHGLDQLGSYFPYILGLAHLALDELAQAVSCFEQGISASTEVHHAPQVCANHLGRAKARLAMTDPPVVAIIDDVRTATRLALETSTWPYMMWAAIEAASVSVAAGKATDEAESLLHLTVLHEATHGQTRIEAQETLDALFGSAVESPDDRSPDLRLDEVAERILEVLLAAAAL